MTITGKNARLVIIDDLGTEIDLGEIQKDSLKLWHEVEFGKENSDHLKVSTEIAIIGCGINTCLSRLVKEEETTAVDIIEAETKINKFEVSGSVTVYFENPEISRQYLTDIQPIYTRTEGNQNKSYNKFLPKPYNFKRRK